MKKVPSNLREVKLNTDAGLTSVMDLEEALSELDVRVALIQALIPLGLEAVKEVLQGEVNGFGRARKTVEKGERPESTVGHATRIGVFVRSESAHFCAAGARRGSQCRSPFRGLSPPAAPESDG